MDNLHYDAFISYRHLSEDMKIASKLQALLENYKIQDNITGKRRRIRIFRDESELLTSGDLGADICSALENSDYLIIVYSATTKESKWCMAELRYFRSLHGNTNDKILPILVSGEPADVLPAELMSAWKEVTDNKGNVKTEKIEIEPLCADIRDRNLRRQISRLKKKEHMRIAAPILGVGFDGLYQRHRRKVMEKMFAIGCVVFAGVFIFSVYNYNMLQQLEEKQEHIRRNESNRIAYIARESSNDVNQAITLALAGVDLLDEGNIAGSDCENVLKQAVFQEEMDEKKDFFHVESRFTMNTRFVIEDTYADGTLITVSDYTDTYLYDIENGELLFQYPGLDIYFNSSATQYITYSREGAKWSFTGCNTDTGTIFYQDEFVMQEEQDGFVKTAYDKKKDAYYLGVWSGDAYPFLKEISSNGKSKDITYNEISDEMKEMMDKTAGDDIINNIYGNPYDYQMADYEQGILPDDKKKHFDEVLSKGFYVKGSYDIGNSRLDCLEISVSKEADYVSYFLIFDNDTDQVVMNTEYKVIALEGSDRLLRYSDNGFEILSVHRDRVPENSDERLRSMISMDGKRFLNVYDTSKEYFDWSTSSFAPLLQLISYSGSGLMKINSSYLLTIGDIDGGDKTDIFSKVIYGNPTDDRQRGSLVFYTTPDMHRIAYVTPEGVLEVVELPSGNVLYSETIGTSMQNYTYKSSINENGELEQEPMATPDVFAVSLDLEGKILAVAYIDNEVALYSVETGQELQRFRTDELFGLSWISCMEFSEKYLLIANSEKTVLLQKDDSGRYDLNQIKSFDGGEECYGAPKFITSDGLLFTTYEMGSDYFLDKIYDIEAGEGEPILKPGAQNYSYDSDTGYLVWEEDTETYRTSSKHIAKRNDKGNFEIIGEIRAETYNMQMPSHGAVLDGDLILLEKEGMTELYDLKTQTKVYTFEHDNLRIQDGCLYDIETFGTSAGSVYDLNIDFSVLREKAEKIITSSLGRRSLNDAERKKYYIDESLYDKRKQEMSGQFQ